MKLPVKTAGLDSGYDTIAIHFGLSRLGIKAFIRPCERGVRRNTDKFSIKDFIWKPESNFYVCPNNCKLTYRGTWIWRGIPMQNYVSNPKDCDNCSNRKLCFTPNLRKR